MSDEYFVKLTGKLAPGRAPDMAADLLSKIFHIPMEKGRFMFKGEPTLLRKKLDKETAEKIIHRLRNVGAECVLELAEDEFNLTLELIDEAPAKAPTPEDEIQLQPVREEEAPSFDLELVTPSALDAEPALDRLEMMDMEPVVSPEPEAPAPTAPEPAGIALEAPPAPPPPPPSPKVKKPAPVADESEDINVGDVATGQVSGGSGGMLPQASMAPAFKRPMNDPEQQEKPKGGKPLLPVFLLLALLGGGAAWFLLSSEPEPPPKPVVAVQKPAAPIKPAQLPPSALTPIHQLDIQATKVKMKALSESILTWQRQFGKGVLPTGNLERVKVDMGVSDGDLTDAWGSSIQYLPAGNGFALLSPGPDKQPGNADDIRVDAQP